MATFVTMRYGQRWRERADLRYGVQPKRIAGEQAGADAASEERHSEEGDATSDLVGRQRSRPGQGDLPVVEQVLKRTVSMSSATAHN